MAEAVVHNDLRFMWLEITGRCQLRCAHCYASSGPDGTHGVMAGSDWHLLIDQAVDMGVSDVQFIGGEPTLHPDFPGLLRYAVAKGLGVEVYTNLARSISEELWALFAMPGVHLATSYYAADSTVHGSITGLPASYHLTRSSLVEAVRRGLPLRVGVVQVREDQAVDAAIAELRSIGVRSVGVDRMRQVGRGVRGRAPGVEELCGKCADGVLAVSPSGDVWPCVFSRWMGLGNVRDTNLSEINSNAMMARAKLRKHFVSGADCQPNCGPNACDPLKGDGDPHGCNPDYKPCPPWKR